jgi:hypothetical protein
VQSHETRQAVSAIGPVAVGEQSGVPIFFPSRFCTVCISAAGSIQTRAVYENHPASERTWRHHPYLPLRSPRRCWAFFSHHPRLSAVDRRHAAEYSVCRGSEQSTRQRPGAFFTCSRRLASVACGLRRFTHPTTPRPPAGGGGKAEQRRRHALGAVRRADDHGGLKPEEKGKKSEQTKQSVY